jgi:hypothetical protein
MALKQRLLRAEKRCPAPPTELEWPGITAIAEEWKRMEAFLAEKGLTADEAYRRKLKVPGNRIVHPLSEAEKRRICGELTAKQAAQAAAKGQRAFAAGRTSSVTQPGVASCTSSNVRPAP